MRLLQQRLRSRATNATQHISRLIAGTEVAGSRLQVSNPITGRLFIYFSFVTTS
ncbi:unnamed protein product [Gongylonema pulchrum]|uniref:Uncharacterized protein n=1 Tax=Gongylonema pulchrum TaxID=637853 RepID=A0A3P6RCG6_9BILA|nr:unnamed protein product [Gongylonema pulchrum]